MNKNVTVLDESGNEIGATYWKRARGLVKKGRARFVSDTAIRLACPPNRNDEEDKMQNNIIEETKAVQETADTDFESAVAECESVAASTTDGSAAEAAANRYTMAYCLEQIESIHRQASGMEEMLRSLQNMIFGSSEGRQPLDASVSLAAMEVFRDTVKSREITNQQLLTFYSKMYDDLKNAEEKEPTDSVKEKARLQERLIDMYQQVAISNGYEADEMSDVMNGILDGIRHL